MIEAQPKLESALKAVAAADPNRIEYRMALLGPEHRDAVDFFQMDIPITTGSSLYAEQTSFARSVAQLPMVRLDDVVGGGKLIAVLKARDFLLSDLYPVLRNRTGSLLQVDAVFLRRGSPFWAKPPFF